MGPRTGGGRVLVQTRQPDHEVVQAAVRADPSPVAERERARRQELRFPPAASVATVSGEGAGPFIDRLGTPLGIEVLGPTDDAWLLRADDIKTLADALAATPRPKGRLRVAVDPLRL